VTDENDISAQKEAEKERTWFQEKNEDQLWQKGAKKQKKKGKKEVDSLRPLSRGPFYRFFKSCTAVRIRQQVFPLFPVCRYKDID